MKLLIFTEHKDTLDYLAGDGKDGRPLGKLREWGLTVTQIHGGMKIGDRDTPGTRIYAEREFREDCPGAGRHRGRRRGHQPPVLLVHDQLRHPLEPGPPRAAHGPHPPLRPGARLPHLQLRRREHPRGPRACRSSSNGSARSAANWAPTRSSTSSARSSRRTCWRSCSATCTPRRTDEQTSRRGSSRDVDPERFRQITESTLEGLAKRELNLSAHRRQVGRGARAAPGARGDRGLLRRGRPHRRRPPEAGPEGRPRLPRRQGAAHTSCPSASGWSRASAGSAASTRRSSSTRRSCRPTRRWSG